MNRTVFAIVFAGALAVALAFRLADPAARPMHHDEANQAVRFGELLETGEYRYDLQDHHGPTLYYLTLPFAWARGQHVMAALDERTLRMVPAAFGSGLLLLFLPLSRGIGRPAVAAAATLAAVSPALTYYSRFYIQESLLVFFTLAFLVAAGRYVLRPHSATAIGAGVLAGLAWATKETAVVMLPVAVLAIVIAARVSRDGRDAPRPGARNRVRHALAALGGALVPAFLFYSAFFRNPGGLFDSVRALSVYVSRGLESSAHAQPWSYYLHTLAWSSSGGLVWSEAFVLVLAVAGAVHAVAVRRTAFWPLCLTLYATATLAIFSALPYKTPWNLLPFYAAIVLMAGIGAAALLRLARPGAARVLVAVVLTAATWQLAAQNVRASFHYPADERNPYAYAHTSPDYLRLVARVHDLAALHPGGRDMLVKVVAGPYEQWPFPWYARELTSVGYWSSADAASPLDGAAVIVASQDTVSGVEAALGGRYLSEFYGLRPGVLITLYIEPGLWYRFLDSRR